MSLNKCCDHLVAMGFHARLWMDPALTPLEAPFHTILSLVCSKGKCHPVLWISSCENVRHYIMRAVESKSPM